MVVTNQLTCEVESRGMKETKSLVNSGKNSYYNTHLLIPFSIQNSLKPLNFPLVLLLGRISIVR